MTPEAAAEEMYPEQIDAIILNDQRIEYDYHEDYRKAFIAGHKSRDPEVERLVEALRHIENPIKYMQDHLEPGYVMNGGMAIQLSESASYLKGIAKEALKQYQQ